MRDGQTKRLAIDQLGLMAGIAFFLLILLLPAPPNVSNAGWQVAAVATLMALWWMTEAVPLAATALVPVVLLPMLGTVSLEAVAHSYSHPLIFMFLGGFIIGKALERWNLHLTIANTIIDRAPRSAGGLIGSIMLATAFLSMWISNTATAMVMVSIAHSITKKNRRTPHGTDTHEDEYYSRSIKDQFSTALMLGVAFSATIGGMATIIGTPPNALLVAYLHKSHNINIGFAQWMGIGVPLVIILLPITWYLLTRIVFDLRSIQLDTLGCNTATDTASKIRSTPLPAGAKIVSFIALVTVVLLLLRPYIQTLFPTTGISDAGILMSAALLLLVLPDPGTNNERLLQWENVETIRWDVLILFGGGLALASAVEVSGLAQSAGSIFTALSDLPLMMIIVVAMVAMVLMGELASNTAIAAVFLPVAGAAAVAMEIPPLEFVIPIGLAASLGFMLPVATPPNAIAYGSGDISSGQLLKAGALLDLAGIVVVFVVAVSLGPVVFG